MSAADMEVTIEDESDRVGALALQGPLSRDILEQVSPADFGKLRYFRLMHTSIRDIPATITRTGYTGDLGYEIWVDADDAVRVWDALMDAGRAYGITPAGIWALDIARIEAGLVMMGVDYFSSHRAMIEDQKSSPFELGLGWTVSLDKGPYTGKRALAREAARGPAWAFVGLDVDWDSLDRLHAARGLSPHVPTIAWRTSAPVYTGPTQIGYATSGCWSPLLKRYLALAHLQSPHFSEGAKVQLEVTVEHRRQRAEAVVRRLPFYEPERKRA
jgi:aminomethyltransferase